MKLAIIGGSLLSELNGLSNASEAVLDTPFGKPSDKYTSGSLGGVELIYINRHGASHNLAPHQINYRANMFGLKQLGVTHVIAVTVVGGISKNMSPMQWVIPDQIIDYTYGRMQSYNDVDESAVNHIDFSFPFSEDLRMKLKSALLSENLACISKATYGVTQGPRLETAAEILRMEKDGCDIVGMTAMPEAALARELEMEYVTVSLVVNWAAGKSDNKEVLLMEEIVQRIAEGNALMPKVLHQLSLSVKT